MLVLHHAAIGYRVRFSTNVSDLDELKKSLSRNPDIKEIILVDDCFGQAYFNMKESQNAELLSLINYVNASQNKLLILNSRITILKEAKERKPELLKCFEGKQCKVYILDMTAIDIVEKAKIFYNHISFNGMHKEYFAEIKRRSDIIALLSIKTIHRVLLSSFVTLTDTKTFILQIITSLQCNNSTILKKCGKTNMNADLKK